MDLVKFFKYSVDRVLALLLILSCSPLLIAIASCVALGIGAPIVLEERIGERGRCFALFRFRTAKRQRLQADATESPKDAMRTTGFGRLLTRTRLASLPQLLNILIGEMSFVGPRPARRQETDAYTPRQARRLRFRPGITGWSQVHERTGISEAGRIELDLHYVDHYSPWLDIKTLWHTLVPVRARAQHEPALATREAKRGAPDPVVVIGAGGLALAIVDAIEQQGRNTIVGLVDDKPTRHGAVVLGYPVLGGRDVLRHADIPNRAVVALGSPRARAAWFAHLEELGFELPAIVHPTAVLGRETPVGPGSILLAGVVASAGAQICRGVVINTTAVVGSGCHIGDFAHVAPGSRLGGGVRVGTRTYVGIGASVVQGIDIGDDAVIGANAAVVQSVPAGATAVGVPARLVRGPSPAARHGAGRALARG